MQIGIVGLTFILTAQAQNSDRPNTFSLVPASDQIGACLPHASAKVIVFPKEEVRGVDTLDLKAEGLPANVSFTVFLTGQPNFPFGAAEYIGEFTTNAQGKGSMRVDAVINEAFSSTLVGTERIREELDHVVIWFADPADDDFCPAPGTGVTTPFDGDGESGAAVLSSRNFLPGAPLPSDGVSPPLPASTSGTAR